MISKRMAELGSKRSVIRETFEYGRQRAAVIGEDNVFDFSLGNPNVDSPETIAATAIELLKTVPAAKLHGYTSAQGDATVRKAISDSLNRRFNAGITPDKIYMTCGAAASLTITLKALCSGSDDEFIIFAPFFPEYRVFIETAGASSAVVPASADFQIDFSALEKVLNKNTKGLIINSPNNPSGVVYNSHTIAKLSELLEQKEAEYGHPIYLISDEPYREIVYCSDAPFVSGMYKNTIICYSFSKSLSLPGERIGYIAVPERCADAALVYAAICGAGRALGYVCAPSLFQRVVAQNADSTADLSVYKTNRDLLYKSLTEYGYECVSPDGAFYLFVKSPISDAAEFCMRARKYELLFVAGDDFGCTGYVRIAYCVKTSQIERALPAFKALIEEYK